jgi:hypothetical protein
VRKAVPPIGRCGGTDYTRLDARRKMGVMTDDDLAAIVAALGRLIDHVDRGELDAPPLMLARLAGARDALALLPTAPTTDSDSRG